MSQSKYFKIVKHNFQNNDREPFELTPSQEEIFRIIFTRRYPRVQCITYTQFGKLISDDVPVITSKGWKTHGAIEIGDYVFSPTGKPVKVLNIMNKDGEADYEIEFTNKDKIKCNAKHEWLVAHNSWSRSKNPYRILETQEIANRKDYKLFSLPLIKPLEFGKKKLPIDPYTLGVWLGDGISVKPSFVGCPEDKAIADNIPYKLSSKQTHKETGVILYNFFKTDLLNNLRKLDLIKNKHIPDIYKFSSINQRLELLAGLIDTDGTVNKKKRENGWRNGRIYFANTNKQLIDDVKYLVESFGIRTSITKVEPTTSSSGVIGRKATYYLGFQPFVDIPTKLKRKKIKAFKKHRRIRIKNVKKINPVKGKCLNVEGGMYLVGQTMIPTHNSDVSAISVLSRVTAFPERWAIVAPSTKKAGIIMGYIIDHIFDNPIFRQQFKIKEGEDIERIRRERRKDYITFDLGRGEVGGVYTLSTEGKRTKDVLDAIMGFGAKNIVLDESSLISDQQYAGVKRMLGGHKDNFLFEIGNPFRRNHFLRTWRDPNYHHILVDYKQGIKEGRISEEFIDEMRREKFFDIMYECKFPEEEAIDTRGYMPLVTEADLDRAYVEDIGLFGRLRMGVDVGAGGTGKSVICVRGTNGAKIAYSERNSDTMSLVGEVLRVKDKYGIKAEEIFIDAIGVGKGVADRLDEHFAVDFKQVNKITWGGKPHKKDFINLKAESFWGLKEWLRDAKLVRHKGWEELLNIKYKIQSDKKVKIMSKEDLLKDGIPSPDHADALALTFSKPMSFTKKPKTFRPNITGIGRTR